MLKKVLLFFLSGVFLLTFSCNYSKKSLVYKKNLKNGNSEIKKLKLGDYGNFSILFNEELCDVPNFNVFFDWDNKTQTMLTEAYLPGQVFIMLLNNDGGYKLLGKFGQGPDEIQGAPTCERFVYDNQIGVFTIFYRSFFIMDREGNINFKLSPIPFISSIRDFRLIDDKMLAGDGGYFDKKIQHDMERGVLFTFNLSNLKKFHSILTYRQFLNIFNKFSSRTPHNIFIRIFDNHSFFLGQQYNHHYLVKKSEQKEFKEFMGFFYFSDTKKVIPLYLSPYFNSGDLEIVGYSKIDDSIFIKEMYIPPSLVKRILRRPHTVVKYDDSKDYGRDVDLLKKSELIYKINKNGQIVGIYRYCDDFCDFVFNKHKVLYSRIASCREIAKKKLVIVQFLQFPSDYVRFIIKTKLKTIELK